MSLSLASVFADNMVLQQGTPVAVWGVAGAGAKVVVEFRGKRAEATADGDGWWRAALPALAASSEPGELVASSGGERQSVRNVLVGEVWICSGQSNMEWGVAASNDAEREIASASFPQIRLCAVAKRPSGKPEASLPGRATWSECGPDRVGSFSAVGYFFGRELHQKLGVPIGLVNASWGGTVAEAWTSQAGLLSEPETASIVDQFAADLPRLLELQTKWKKDIEALDARTADKSNEGFPRGWAGLAEPAGEWKDMRLPATWQSLGVDFSGILWFRKVIDIPAAWAGKELQLSIGATDKSDVTYFNNEQVGSVTMAQRQDAWSFLRTYAVPGRLVKAGRAVVAVRVHSDKYAGGMTGPAPVMHVSCPSAGGARIDLSGTWRYAVEANYGVVQIPPPPLGPDNPNAPSTLFNGMIAPLQPMSLRGAVWYQGESNAGRPKQYRTLFQTLIKDWRRGFERPELAFHFVQLANYMAVREQPTQSLWAELREAQTMALALPHTGQAVAIDVGDAGDIHPRNKQDVGRRLAYNALHTTYGKKDITPCGPLFKSMKIEGGAVRITFDHAAGLHVKGGGAVKGFAIAGADRTFVWADAKIDGQSVVVSGVPSPTAVRYAWADNPVCNLYNGAGLPASPFRTDRG